jgi:hypothetical protein
LITIVPPTCTDTDKIRVSCQLEMTPSLYIRQGALKSGREGGTNVPLVFNSNSTSITRSFRENYVFSQTGFVVIPLERAKNCDTASQLKEIMVMMKSCLAHVK